MQIFIKLFDDEYKDLPRDQFMKLKTAWLDLRDHTNVNALQYACFHGNYVSDHWLTSRL